MVGRKEKIFNIRAPRMPENGILGVFVVNRVQKEYANVFSQEGKSRPFSPPLWEGRGRQSPLPPCRKQP